MTSLSAPTSHAKFIVNMLVRRQRDKSVTAHAVFSESRSYEVRAVRQMAMWLLRDLTALGASSTNWIGRQFKRDHTTVLHAVRVIERKRAEDPQFREDTDKLRETVRTMLSMRHAAQMEEGRLLEPTVQA